MRITVGLIAALSGVIFCTASSAQDRLPAYVRGNSYVAGQLLGCTIRLETYHRQTVERAQASGRTLPANYLLNLIAGIDVAALEADAKHALLATSNGPVPIDEMEGAIAEIAGLEYDATSVGTPGYHEAWGQAVACAGLFRQFGLYDLYRP